VQDIAAGASAPPAYKVAPDALAAIYNDVVMPLTKDVQVQYLLQRLG
jgi:chorismate mutase